MKDSQTDKKGQIHNDLSAAELDIFQAFALVMLFLLISGWSCYEVALITVLYLHDCMLPTGDQTNSLMFQESYFKS